jgi:uncharacterized protein YbaR (Trm112 family)
MSLDPKLLEILRCPRTGQTLHPATANELSAIRAALEVGDLKTAAGSTPEDALDDLLVTDNHEWAYGVDQGVPVMLPDLAMDVRATLEASE